MMLVTPVFSLSQNIIVWPNCSTLRSFSFWESLPLHSQVHRASGHKIRQQSMNSIRTQKDAMGLVVNTPISVNIFRDIFACSHSLLGWWNMGEIMFYLSDLDMKNTGLSAGKMSDEKGASWIMYITQTLTIGSC